MSRRVGQHLQRYFSGGNGGGRGVSDGSAGRAAAAIGGGLLGLWLILGGFYTVGASERAIITTFGAYYGQASPGLNYHLPWPIQRVQKVNVTNLNTRPIGGDDTSPQLDESLMLTGDMNIVDLKFNVQWRVADPKLFLFNVRDPEEIIKKVGESAMREIVGRTDLQTIITTGQGNVQTQTAQLMQHTLDSYGAGVSIDEIQIRSANQPPKVLDAFRAVAAAQQQADAAVNRAEGEAASITQQAKGYQAQVVQEAEGEAARFNQVYEQYRLAPAVTKQRLYIETMEKVLKNSNNIVVDSKAANLPLVLSQDALRPRSDPGVTLSPQGAR